MTGRRLLWAAAALSLLAVGFFSRPAAERPSLLPTDAPRLGWTSRAGLDATVHTLSGRVAHDPDDAASAVALADALLRQGRVLNDTRSYARAGQVLHRAASVNASDYEIKRMTATVLLAQHRFREAIAAADQARAVRPDDAWNDAVTGDAHLELGEYDRAFDAFDRMIARRPNAAAYARVSYARELQGDLEEAIRLMSMALEATPPSDPEAQAWHDSQLGLLELERGQLRDAARHFDRARFVFTDYPLAVEGLVQVAAANGVYSQAFVDGVRQFERLPSAGMAVLLGDLAQRLRGDADRYYSAAERLLSSEPAALARFLADRDRDIPRAVELAIMAATVRRDIYTEDALALSLYKAGRTEEALVASRRSLRTGTADRHILTHAALIHAAAGDLQAARRLRARAGTGPKGFDPIHASDAVGIHPAVPVVALQ